MVAAKFVIASILLSATASASSVNYRRDGYNPIDIIINGVKSGITNAQQQVQSLVRGFQSNDGHPTADGLKALITGLDGQIDNSIGVVADLLSPLTFGLSNQVEAAILVPSSNLSLTVPKLPFLTSLVPLLMPFLVPASNLLPTT